MALSLISNYQLLNGGNSNFDAVYLNQSTNRKIYTIESSGGDLPFSLSLVQTGTEFSLFPDVGSPITMGAGDRLTFSVDYQANSSTLPTTSAQLFSTSPIYDQVTPDGVTTTYAGDPVLGPTASIYFGLGYLDDEITRRDLGAIMTKDSDANYLVQKADHSFNDLSSFGLVRTNPKMTGNVKLTVDSTGGIWFNSINSSKVLSDDRFKRYRISPDSSYALDLKKFFDGGSTPTEIVFSLFEANADYTSTQRSLSKQYDKFYQYGVQQENQKYYTENFSFFAPLYLNEDIPEYFVIFRTDGAINKFTYDIPFNQWNSEIKTQILDNSQIVKTFSLKENSSVGKYLRNIVNHPARKRSDLTVSFQTNGYTTFNGVAYQKGSFAQKGELLQDFYSQENPLSVVEEYITLGFQRNGIISSHVINLEFLFDDEEADEYSINRYFGLYVNSIDLASFGLNEFGLYEYGKTEGQTPTPRKGVDGTKVSDKSFTQTNLSGIRLYASADSVERIPVIDYNAHLSSIVESFSTGPTGFQVVLEGDWSRRLNSNDVVNFTAIIGSTSSVAVSSIYYDAQTRNTFIEFPSDTIQDHLHLAKLNFYTPEKQITLRDSIFLDSFIDGSKFFYIKDKADNLHTISTTQERQVYVDSFNQEKIIEFKLKDKTLDLSTMSGFTTMLTQDKADILNSKGRSGLEVEITRPFSPNDFLEVRWNNIVTNNGFPLRWKVQANSTDISAGEAWPFSTIATDIDGDYYLSYFNPGDDGTVTLDVFVKSIVKAFNTFEFKDYEVVAIDNVLYFRSTQDGLSSNGTQLLYSTFFSDTIKLYGQQAPSVGSVNFTGGSDRKRVRAAISKDVAEGLLDDEYFSTKGSYSIIEKYNILGATVSFSPYLDEPIYDADDVLIDYKDVKTKRVIILKDESQEFQKTFDNKVTSYKLFKPSYGILSMYPLRDFDNDFYSSDYTKSYLPELSRYYARDIQPLTVASVAGSLITFTQGATYDNFPLSVPFLKLYADGSQSPDLYNDQAQLYFLASGTTASLYLAPGSTASLAAGDLVLPLLNSKQLFFAENLIFQFKGFLSLSSIVSADDEIRFNQLQNLWDPTRFVTQLLNSEYDRMSENYLKTLVLKSRVVPYINKFVSYEGKDIRENPYRLNYHRAFGTMNFSPSTEKDQADPRFHTHEWPYLDSVPFDFDLNRFTDSAFSYFFENLDTSIYDFSSLKRDWFSEYFSVGYPTEEWTSGFGYSDYQKVLLEPASRFSLFKYESFTGKTYTLFRGQRIQITELNSLGEPVLNSTKYDNYKYSLIIRRKNVDAFVKQDPVEVETVVNEKFKFIVTIITLVVTTFRTPFSRTRYLDLYTLEHMNVIAAYNYAESLLQPYSFVIAAPLDRPLTESVNLQTFTADPNVSPTTDYYDTINESSPYVTNIEQEILPLTISGNYSLLSAFYIQSGFEITASAPMIDQVYSSKTIHLSDNTAYLKFSTVPIVIPVAIPYSSVPWEPYTFYHQEGGNNSLLGLKDRISAAEISRVLQETSVNQVQTFSIHKEDGTTQTTKNFSFGIVTPEKVTRTFDYMPVADSDKPSELFNYPFIGNVLTEEKDLQTLYRYQGDFAPKFRDVLKFWLREDSSFTDYAAQDFLFSNTHIGAELSNFSVLKNQFYSKVSDSEVLRISQNSGYKSLYPYVNEISMDKKDINAWSSSWDSAYYRKYTSVSDYQELPGTVEMLEVKSMLGGKAMKTPKQFNLFQFKLDPNELSYTETESLLTLQVNWGERLIREMMGGLSGATGARESFIEAMNLVPSSFDSSTLDTTVTDYLKANILDLYSINKIDLYVLETGDPGIPARPTIEVFSYSGSDYTYNRQLLIAKGYKLSKNVKVVPLTNFMFQIPINLDSRFYTSVAIGVEITRT